MNEALKAPTAANIVESVTERSIKYPTRIPTSRDSEDTETYLKEERSSNNTETMQVHSIEIKIDSAAPNIPSVGTRTMNAQTNVKGLMSPTTRIVLVFL